ncbi:aldose epimerase family protein [Jiella marina]|uniref:aldose epimerase family protein n=1 Tax=Jiella sp. LLJ827 TaxID=2917712 RepID=UPI002100B447|nr:aldose epimerase family protein [Jiella sp. LLJ827]MCQ0987847.1 galactose mutarotase [Jiella sp. LLJ827]
MAPQQVNEGGAGETGPIESVTITGGGLRARLLTFGAALQDLRLDGHEAPLVLGFEDPALYPEHSPYFGATPGRFANRIANGRFELDGETHLTETNFLGRHTLHGGSRGTGKRIWTLLESGVDFARFGLHLPDGEMGFPGNLDVSCTYRLKAEGTLAILIEATADAPTVCNFAHHSYFNLEDGGRSSIADHRLSIAADSYLPVDEELIPTGNIEPVENTPLDFRAERTIGETPGGFDHNFCLAAHRGPLRQVAEVAAPRSGVRMQVLTTEPGLQFYDGARVARQHPGLDGISYGPHAGLCLEAQVWPDSPNHPDFPRAVLRPGETFRQETHYRFFKD